MNRASAVEKMLRGVGTRLTMRASLTKYWEC